MSPQMNGEPREAAMAPETISASIGSSAPIQGERPLLQPVNTDGVLQTTAIKEDAELAPLFTQEAATDFRSRWDSLQRSFVDDPQGSVRAGDELVAQVLESLTATLKQHQTSTENLRLALRRYRSFFERLLAV